MKEAEPFVEDAKKLAADDENLLVRTRAVEFLALIGAADPGPALNDILSKSQHNNEVLLILNTAVLLKDGKPGYEIKIDPTRIQIPLRPGYSWSVARLKYIHKGLDTPWASADFYKKLYSSKYKKKRR